MFQKTQIQGYKNITAPAELKTRVFNACQASAKGRFVPRQAALSALSAAACLLLCIVLCGSFLKSEYPPFVLMYGDISIGADRTVLPVSEPAASAAMLRTASKPSTAYTILLQTSNLTEIMWADGEADLDSDGSLRWTVMLPAGDTTFYLTLRHGAGTYDVSLLYHSQDGSFSICCQEQLN